MSMSASQSEKFKMELEINSIKKELAEIKANKEVSEDGIDELTKEKNSLAEELAKLREQNKSYMEHYNRLKSEINQHKNDITKEHQIASSIKETPTEKPPTNEHRNSLPASAFENPTTEGVKEEKPKTHSDIFFDQTPALENKGNDRYTEDPKKENKVHDEFDDFFASVPAKKEDKPEEKAENKSKEDKPEEKPEDKPNENEANPFDDDIVQLDDHNNDLF